MLDPVKKQAKQREPSDKSKSAQKALMARAIETEHKHNEVLDALLGQFYRIEEVTRTGQRHGIDRYFKQPHSALVFPVEYKSDEQAAKTGNAYIETVSVDRGKKQRRGWIQTSQAKLLIYYCVAKTRYDEGAVYVFDMAKLREAARDWIERYPMAKSSEALNALYQSEGILVPLRELHITSDCVFTVHLEHNEAVRIK